MTQAIDRELRQSIPKLNITQKQSILAIIKSYLQPAEKEVRISREQYNIEIMEALERVKAGHYLTMEEVQRDAETW